MSTFQTVEQLQAEIERLREALKTIADDCEGGYPPSYGAIKYFVRATLQPKEGTYQGPDPMSLSYGRGG